MLQMSVLELQRRMSAGDDLLLLDVRTKEEWQTAKIAGAKLMLDISQTEIQTWDKNKLIVCQCHHGGRSQKAAERFFQMGFTNVANLAGGIDAWSQQVDPKVPRY